MANANRETPELVYLQKMPNGWQILSPSKQPDKDSWNSALFAAGLDGKYVENGEGWEYYVVDGVHVWEFTDVKA